MRRLISYLPSFLILLFRSRWNVIGFILQIYTLFTETVLKQNRYFKTQTYPIRIQPKSVLLYNEVYRCVFLCKYGYHFGPRSGNSFKTGSDSFQESELYFLPGYPAPSPKNTSTDLIFPRLKLKTSILRTTFLSVVIISTNKIRSLPLSVILI